MKYHTLFFRKLGKMSQKLSSAAGALRVKNAELAAIVAKIHLTYLKPF